MVEPRRADRRPRPRSARGPRPRRPPPARPADRPRRPVGARGRARRAAGRARARSRARTTPVDPALAARCEDASSALTGFEAKVARPGCSVPSTATCARGARRGARAPAGPVTKQRRGVAPHGRLWLQDIESLEAISQDDVTRSAVPAHGALSQNGRLQPFLRELEDDRDLDAETKATLAELAQDEASSTQSRTTSAARAHALSRRSQEAVPVGSPAYARARPDDLAAMAAPRHGRACCDRPGSPSDALARASTLELAGRGPAPHGDTAGQSGAGVPVDERCRSASRAAPLIVDLSSPSGTRGR